MDAKAPLLGLPFVRIATRAHSELWWQDSHAAGQAGNTSTPKLHSHHDDQKDWVLKLCSNGFERHPKAKESLPFATRQLWWR